MSLSYEWFMYFFHFLYTSFYGFTCNFDDKLSHYEAKEIGVNFVHQIRVADKWNEQFVVHTLHLMLSVVLHIFHFMLHSMLEESGGSNGSRSLRYRPELDFLSMHLDWFSPASVLHLFLWCSLTQHSLGAYWKGFIWLLLSEEEWAA